MVDRSVVASKVAIIRDAVARVREMLPASADAFADDRTAREVVALNILVAVQEAIDLASHWIADAGLVVPGTQRELFQRLAEEQVISPDLAARLASAAGMRNVVAHAYGSVDWRRVHAAAASELGDLESLCDAVARASTARD